MDLLLVLILVLAVLAICGGLWLTPWLWAVLVVVLVLAVLSYGVRR